MNIRDYLDYIDKKDSEIIQGTSNQRKTKKTISIGQFNIISSDKEKLSRNKIIGRKMITDAFHVRGHYRVYKKNNKTIYINPYIKCNKSESNVKSADYRII